MHVSLRRHSFSPLFTESGSSSPGKNTPQLKKRYWGVKRKDKSWDKVQASFHNLNQWLVYYRVFGPNDQLSDAEVKTICKLSEPKKVDLKTETQRKLHASQKFHLQDWLDKKPLTRPDLLPHIPECLFEQRLKKIENNKRHPNSKKKKLRYLPLCVEELRFGLSKLRNLYTFPKHAEKLKRAALGCKPPLIRKPCQNQNYYIKDEVNNDDFLRRWIDCQLTTAGETSIHPHLVTDFYKTHYPLILQRIHETPPQGKKEANRCEAYTTLIDNDMLNMFQSKSWHHLRCVHKKPMTAKQRIQFQHHGTIVTPPPSPPPDISKYKAKHFRNHHRFSNHGSAQGVFPMVTLSASHNRPQTKRRKITPPRSATKLTSALSTQGSQLRPFMSHSCHVSIPKPSSTSKQSSGRLYERELNYLSPDLLSIQPSESVSTGSATFQMPKIVKNVKPRKQKEIGERSYSFQNQYVTPLSTLFAEHEALQVSSDESEESDIETNDFDTASIVSEVWLGEEWNSSSDISISDAESIPVDVLLQSPEPDDWYSDDSDYEGNKPSRWYRKWPPDTPLDSH